MNRIIRNATPHDIYLCMDEECKVKILFAKSDVVARLKEEIVKNDNDFPTIKMTLGELPPKRNGVLWIVSKPVAMMAGRDDFIVPINFVRDGDGRIIGCRDFAFVDGGEKDENVY